MHYPGREQVPSCPGIACELKILGTQLMLVTLQTYVFWITRPALNSLFGNRQNQKQASVTVFSGVCVHCHIMGLNLTQYESHILFPRIGNVRKIKTGSHYNIALYDSFCCRSMQVTLNENVCKKSIPSRTLCSIFTLQCKQLRNWTLRGPKALRP